MSLVVDSLPVPNDKPQMFLDPLPRHSVTLTIPAHLAKVELSKLIAEFPSLVSTDSLFRVGVYPGITHIEGSILSPEALNNAMFYHTNLLCTFEQAMALRAYFDNKESSGEHDPKQNEQAGVVSNPKEPSE